MDIFLSLYRVTEGHSCRQSVNILNDFISVSPFQGHFLSFSQVKLCAMTFLFLFTLLLLIVILQTILIWKFLFTYSIYNVSGSYVVTRADFLKGVTCSILGERQVIRSPLQIVDTSSWSDVRQWKTTISSFYSETFLSRTQRPSDRILWTGIEIVEIRFFFFFKKKLFHLLYIHECFYFFNWYI